MTHDVPQHPTDDDLAAVAAELVAMAAEDNAAAPRANSDDFADQLAWRRLTARHADRLTEILDAHGWPTADRFGADAARAAWLIAQHADRQLDVQRRALSLLERAVTDGLASPRDLAFLQDRTRVNDGREQLYGTQIAGVRNGAPIPWPCQDPESMDQRRAEVGIPPFDDYVAQFS
ncbi:MULTISPECIES: DUF6624 domain-containing protein [unclassified Streptomyces]|uniref:DUF6624 domain-containing protein n=1 Tax=unclassified Streptomyces TaxID=2593676 RepID=UPI00037113B5|nr:MULTISPECIES: DUF6624 domain-containing protein [unclassified Streptomyces]MYT27267.1 hypothetical protein [Streptomyces sp. SID8354]